MHCNAGAASLANTGFYQDRMARYSSNRWRYLTTSSTYKQRNVECDADAGGHGHNTNGGLYAKDSSGNNTTGGWTNDFLADDGLQQGSVVLASAPGVAASLRSGCGLKK